MHQLLTFTIIGLVTGALYAVAASGLVVTYTTSGIFNFAHGAFGMLAAFVYWKLRFAMGWPAPVALVVVLVILAPLFGAAVERFILRGLAEVSEVTKLVVTVALLFGVYQWALILFPTGIGRNFPGFFEGRSIDLGVYDLSYHEAITFAAAIATALGLRFLLFRTRSGIAMRSVVDDRDLTRLNGARPNRSSMLSWALGSALAALAGILFAGSQGTLSQITLTLLVINAYGAAMFGRLRSLPLTFLGAMVLGLAQSYAVGYINLTDPVHSVAGLVIDPALSLNGLRPAIPIIALFVVLLFIPPLRAKAGGQRRSREVIPAPPPRRWLIGAAVLALLALGFATEFPGQRTFQMGQGLALGIVMLSLVPLIGYAGQISLAPLAFAGIGAVVMGNLGGNGNPLILLLAVVVTAAVGALVALPALRLQGLYLALATAAFAVLVDLLVFTQGKLLPNGNLNVPRLELLGISFHGNRAHLALLGAIFGLVASGLVWLRGRPFGRRLLAMKSSEAACATLGVSLTRTKLAVFTLSAGIAGLGGALYAAQLNSISPTSFQFIAGLPVVLLAVIGGIASVGGALFGGIIYALALLILPDVVPSIANLLLLGPALAGISLGRNPNGAVIQTVTDVRASLRARRQKVAAASAARDEATLGESEPALEDLGLEGFAPEEVAMLDRATGLDQEPLYGALSR